MIGSRGNRRADGWSVALGAATGLAAGLLLGRRGWRVGPPGWVLAERELGLVEEEIVSRFLDDPVLRNRAIEVAALAPGIVELTGSVRDEDEADHAVEVAQGVPGVRTVLNRFDLEVLEEHLADTRRRFDLGDPALRETRWQGLRVGTGRRRQGRETEPDRPDDKVSIVSHSLGTDRAVEDTSEELDKLMPGVEGHSMTPAAPTDRGRADEASHRRLGNVGPEPLQDLNPEARIHENVKPGTELDLEESGAEEELERRRLEERS